MPRPLSSAQAIRLAAPQGNRLEWSTPASSHCSYICTWMMDNVSLAFVIYLLASLSFFLVERSSNILSSADCYHFFSWLINHNSRIKLLRAFITLPWLRLPQSSKPGALCG
jgi:hypothetical protein